MKFVLEEGLFQNGSYTVEYGNKKATFTLIEEDYVGKDGAHLEINRMICTVKEYDETGALLDEQFGSLVIGLGDTNIAVTTSEPSLRGNLLAKGNMGKCVVELYEE